MNSAERRELYARLVREERARIKPSVPCGDGKHRASGAQIAAAKARATKRFFAMGL